MELSLIFKLFAKRVRTRICQYLLAHLLSRPKQLLLLAASVYVYVSVCRY